MATPTINRLNDPRGFAIDPFRYDGADAPVSQPMNTTPLIINQMNGGGIGNDSLGSYGGGGNGFPGATMSNGVSGPTTGVASFANSAAATLGNLGLTSLSDAIAKNVDPNYSHEGRAARGSTDADAAAKTDSAAALADAMANAISGAAPTNSPAAPAVSTGGWAASIRDSAVAEAPSAPSAPSNDAPSNDAPSGPNTGPSTGGPASTGTSGGSPADATDGGGGGGGGGKIICTRLYQVGLMPRDIYLADQAFGKQLAKHDPVAMDGYHRWASHVVRWMQRGDWFGTLVTKMAYWIATPWALEMGRRMGLPVKRTAAGWLLMEVGLKICQWAGRSPAALARSNPTP